MQTSGHSQSIIQFKLTFIKILLWLLLVISPEVLQACNSPFCFLCMCAQLLSHVWLFVTPWTAARQVLLSMEFSRQEYRQGLPFPPPGDLSNPGIKPVSPALAGGFFTSITSFLMGPVETNSFKPNIFRKEFLTIPIYSLLTWALVWPLLAPFVMVHSNGLENILF